MTVADARTPARPPADGPSPEDADFMVLRAIACRYESGTVAPEAIRRALDGHARPCLAASELDDALARLRRDGHVIARDGEYVVGAAVAAALPPRGAARSRKPPRRGADCARASRRTRGATRSGSARPLRE
ncbi:hypothetical protein [Roseisolibacter sp. H3M3-2]|uniref:hypothetical protein n=1 Tax=Roseisolibacter sp. H3M3-2 TaxID=3031323 RepID=UPI0023DAED38|nr:hypothetical protein [Roseisolibacter sp. H3M3-2]MDF1506098.1 hypothetical protein [Roseisolibacter sp. H3M3-2]